MSENRYFEQLAKSTEKFIEDGYKELYHRTINAIKKYCNKKLEDVATVEGLQDLFNNVKDTVSDNKVSDYELSAIVAARMVMEEWMDRVDEYAPIQHTRGIIQLNPFLGCNCGCLYCFRNDAKGGLGEFYFGHKPVQILSVKQTIDYMQEHPWFIPNITQIGINTSSTDCFLPAVKETTFELIDEIVKRGFKNDILLISKMFLSEDDVKRLDSYDNNILLFLTYTANRENIEPVCGSEYVRKKKFEQLVYLNRAKRLKWAHYYRPLAEGWNDSEEQILEALRFGENSGITVIGGLKLLTNMEDIAYENNIVMPKGDFKNRAYKFLSTELLEKVLEVYNKNNIKTILVGDQSCGIALLKAKYGHPTPNVEALRLYDEYSRTNKKDAHLTRPNNNIRYGCFEKCSAAQIKLCSGLSDIMPNQVNDLLSRIGLGDANYIIKEDGIHVDKMWSGIPNEQDKIMFVVNILKVPVFFDL